MELDAPVKLSDQSYTVKINTESNITVQYPSRESGTHTTPPETAEQLQVCIRALAAMFETYSKRWFHNQVQAFVFIKRLSHVWQFESHQPYSGPLPENGRGEIQVRQTWCPEQLHILPRNIQIHWKLLSASYEVEKPSGLLSTGLGSLEEFSVDTLPEAGGGGATGPPGFDLRISGVREKALRKVRAARLRAAVAKWHANELVARYYERYGTTELLDGDSELSSDDEATQTGQPENKK
jgi:hypothetical protein